jgi:hypothetical protein
VTSVALVAEEPRELATERRIVLDDQHGPLVTTVAVAHRLGPGNRRCGPPVLGAQELEDHRVFSPLSRDSRSWMG